MADDDTPAEIPDDDWLLAQGWSRLESARPGGGVTWWHPRHPVQVSFERAVEIQQSGALDAAGEA